MDNLIKIGGVLKRSPFGAQTHHQQVVQKVAV